MAKFKQGDHVFAAVWDASMSEYGVSEYTVQDVLGINLYWLTPGDRYAPESYVSDTQRGAEILATEKTIDHRRTHQAHRWVDGKGRSTEAAS